MLDITSRLCQNQYHCIKDANCVPHFPKSFLSLPSWIVLGNGNWGMSCFALRGKVRPLSSMHLYTWFVDLYWLEVPVTIHSFTHLILDFFPLEKKGFIALSEAFLPPTIITLSKMTVNVGLSCFGINVYTKLGRNWQHSHIMLRSNTW